MTPTVHPTPTSAAAGSRAPATRSLELLQARQARDGLATLLRAERTAAADFLLALADFDRRRGWEPLGHASLFAFLRVELGLSTSATFWRMSAARLLQRFPELIDPLRDGRLCLTTTAELAKVLTTENRAEVLPRFFGTSSREAKELVAEMLPGEAPPMRAVVTAVDRSGLFAHLVSPQMSTSSLEQAPTAAADLVPPTSDLTLRPLRVPEMGMTHPARVIARRDDVEPLTADLRRLHVTVSRHLLAKLDAARDGLSHAIPGAGTDQVLEAALDLLLEKQARARAQVKRPRKTIPPVPVTSRPPAGATRTSNPPPSFEEPHHRRTGPREPILAAVRRAVWERDLGRCVWPLDSGGCCGSTHRLQLDHLDPSALDGKPTVENLRLTCERHNQLAARQVFGARCIGRYSGAMILPEPATSLPGSARSGR